MSCVFLIILGKHYTLVSVNLVAPQADTRNSDRKCQNTHPLMNFHVRIPSQNIYVSTICNYVRIMSEWCWKEILLSESPVWSNGPISESTVWSNGPISESLYGQMDLCQNPLYGQMGPYQNPLYGQMGLYQNPLYGQMDLCQNPLYGQMDQCQNSHGDLENSLVFSLTATLH